MRVRGNTIGRRKAFGRRLRAAREALEISQTELARRLDLDRPQVSNVEAGRSWVAPHRLADVAKVLGTSLDDLFGVTG